MSHPRPPRALSPAEISTLATDLIALASILARHDAPKILATIATVARPDGLRSALATTDGGIGGGEGHDDGLTHDRPAAYATQLLIELHRLRIDIPAALSALHGWSPSRPVSIDTRCGHPLTTGQTTCQRTDADGQKCGAIEIDRRCDRCGLEVPAGQWRKRKCNACRMALARDPYKDSRQPQDVWVG